jgi:hypothetical protein
VSGEKNGSSFYSISYMPKTMIIKRMTWNNGLSGDLPVPSQYASTKTLNNVNFLAKKERDDSLVITSLKTSKILLDRNTGWAIDFAWLECTVAVECPIPEQGQPITTTTFKVERAVVFINKK